MNKPVNKYFVFFLAVAAAFGLIWKISQPTPIPAESLVSQPDTETSVEESAPLSRSNLSSDSHADTPFSVVETEASPALNDKSLETISEKHKPYRHN